MNSVTEPVVRQARFGESSLTVAEWLDALSSGACDEAQFLGGVAEPLRISPDSGWELLGLVDQYYRRGKLSAHTFGLVKTHLQGLMVGKGTSDELSTPPRMQDEPVPAPKTPPPPPAAAPPLLLEAAPAAAPSAPRGAASVGDPSPRPLAAGDVLRGRYVVQGLVGQGAMGTVYAAIDQFRLDRHHGEQQVALKVLHTEVIKRPRLFAELRREFQHLQTLSHPNIVRVHEFDRDGDLAFFTMEFLSGALLSRVLSGADASPLYRPYALAVIRDVGAAVAHAHARGIVHGDLNPANIFVTDQGEVRVLDFGASHQLRRDPWISDFENHQQIKVATPGYASCQVLEGETAEARDDVFSLACIVYLLLTGGKPFRDVTALKARTARMSPPRPRGLTARQWNVLRVGLNFDRDRRPADVQDWLRRLDLKGAAPRLPPLPSLRTARPPRRGGRDWAVATALIAGLAALAWLSMQRADSRARAENAVGAAVTWTVDHAITGELWAKGLLSGSQAESAGEAPAVPEEPAEAAQPAPQPTAQPPAPPSAVAAMNARTSRSAPASRSESATGPAGGAVNSSGVPARAHIDLAADSVELAPSDPIAHIVVRRTRNMRDDVSFTWWTETGTAKPGRDFVPVKAQVEHIDSGQSSVSLIIPVVVDPARRESRNFYVVIDQPSDNATLGTHTLTMVTVPGSED